MPRGTRVATSHSQPRTLRLASNALRCEGVEALRPLLRGASALRELDLSDNALGTAGVLLAARNVRRGDAIG